MAKFFDLKRSIRGKNFFIKHLPFFGGRRSNGDQFAFDSRGAVRITDMEIVTPSGEIKKIRAIVDAGVSKSFTPADPMMLRRPYAGNSVDPQAAMDAYHSWAYAAIKPIADEIACIEWRFFKLDSKGKQKEIMDHELINFLEAVNEFQTGAEFKHTLTTHLELAGNAYLLLLNKSGEPVKTFTEKPAAMHLLDPGHVKVILDKSQFPFRLVRYDFTFEGKMNSYKPESIIQIKWPNPSSAHIGLGTVQGVAEWIDNDNAATEFLRRFFKNGAQIGVTFETDMTSEEQLHMIRDSFGEQHAGVDNAYKALFLPKGVKKSADSVKFDQLGMDTLSDVTRDKILAGFRVPKTVIGAAEATTNRATAETADYVFARRTIKPKMILICSYLNEFLVPRFAKDIFISFEDPVTEDKMATSNLMKNSTGGAPVMSVNEAREEYLDMEPIDGGEKLMVPTTFTVSTDQPNEPVQAPNEGVEPGNKEQKNKRSRRKIGYMPVRIGSTRTQFDRNMETRKKISEDLTDAIMNVLKELKSKKVKDLSDEEFDTVICKERDIRITDYSKQIIAALRNMNDQQREEVMRKLPDSLKSQKALIDVTKLFDMDKWINFTVQALKGIAVEMFGKEALRALEMIDQPGFDVVNTPEAKNALDHALNLLGRSYNQSTMDLLKAKLTEGLAAGEGVEELGKRISDIYAWKNEYAAERVALTETRRIVSMSNTIAWKQSGVVKELRWITSGRDNVCEFCQAMDDTVISIDENFLDHNDEFEGSDGGVMTADYSAVGGPPLHPNCHCNVRPVVTTEIEAAAEAPKQKEDDDAKIIDEEINRLENDA